MYLEHTHVYMCIYVGSWRSHIRTVYTRALLVHTIVHKALTYHCTWLIHSNM